jgi:hypothetical protein
MSDTYSTELRNATEFYSDIMSEINDLGDLGVNER